MARRKLPHIEVVWHDAVAYGHPMPIADIPKRAALIERHTTGYLVYQDDERIVLAQTYDPSTESVDDLIAIPAPWVRRKRRKT